MSESRKGFMEGTRRVGESRGKGSKTGLDG